MKKFTLFLILSLFAFGLFAQNVTWQNLTATAELGRQGAFDFFDADRNITILGGKGPATINDEIISYTGADYYLQSVGTTAPYTLTTTAQNSIYSNILSERYIYTEALGSTYNANGCSGSQPFPIAMIYTNNGGVWAGVTSSAKPVNPAIVEFNNYIWQLGGSCYCSASTNYFNTISKSTDGVNFTTVSTTGVFSARDQTLPVVNNGSLYLFGGHYNAGSDVYYKDVYTSTNGADWTCLTRNAGFGNITNGGSAWSYNNLMYVYNADTASIYLSVSGTVWSTLTTINSFSPLARLWPVCQYVGNNQLFVVGGEVNTGTAYYSNDSFYGVVDVNDLTATFTQTPTPGQTTTITPTPTITVTPTIIPTSNITPVCPLVQLTVAVPYAANYGCVDNSGNFWIGAFDDILLYKITPAGVVTSYGTGVNQPIQLAFDGTYVWTGDNDAAIRKFDTSGNFIKKYNFGQLGTGGVQGLFWNGTNLIVALAEVGGGAGSGRVCLFNPSTEAVSLTVTGQTNVNGVSWIISSGQSYILTACAGFWGKINANTGVWSKIDCTSQSSSTGYRLTTDGLYVYVADFLTGYVLKYNLFNGSFVTKWLIGSSSYLNTILYDGNYLWTAGDDLNVNISDTNGNIICTLPGMGKCDLVQDGGTVWSLNGAATGHAPDAVVYKLSLMNPTLTPTPIVTPTATPTVTSISTPYVQDLGQKTTTENTLRYLKWQKYPDILNPQYVISYGLTTTAMTAHEYIINDMSESASPDLFVYPLNGLKVSGTYQAQLQVNIGAMPGTSLNSNIITVKPAETPLP